MSARARIPQAEWTRVIRGALKAGLPVGSFKVVEENGHLAVLPIAANEPSDPFADCAARMREAFGD
jgi:hypothetical protein